MFLCWQSSRAISTSRGGIKTSSTERRHVLQKERRRERAQDASTFLRIKTRAEVGNALRVYTSACTSEAIVSEIKLNWSKVTVLYRREGRELQMQLRGDRLLGVYTLWFNQIPSGFCPEGDSSRSRSTMKEMLVSHQKWCYWCGGIVYKSSLKCNSNSCSWQMSFPRIVANQISLIFFIPKLLRKTQKGL